MKIKKILVLGIIMLLVFIIYLITLDDKIYYLSLGDSLAIGTNKSKEYNKYLADYLNELGILEKYVNDYSDKEQRTIDLINDIKRNKKIVINNKTETLKNALVKADIITLSIGKNDLLSKLNYISEKENPYKYADIILLDMDKLLKLIREYCKEDIYLIGIYDSNKNIKNKRILNYIDKKSELLCKKYNINYISTNKIKDNKNVHQIIFEHLKSKIKLKN